MSKEIARKLIEELQTNEELKAKVEGVTDPEELTRIANESGYDVTLGELIDAERAYRRDKAAETDEKLSFDELEEVAGGCGAFYVSDDREIAPDGQMMGCMTHYHFSGWAEENNTWCKLAFYCESADARCNGFDSGCVSTYACDGRYS